MKKKQTLLINKIQTFRVEQTILLGILKVFLLLLEWELWDEVEGL